MVFRLEYGRTGHLINIDDDCDVEIIEPVLIKGLENQSRAVTTALREPYNSKPLKDIINSDDKVGIIFSDITRATPYNIIMPALLDELEKVPRENISFFCSNGTHRLATEEELIRILGSDIVSNYKIIQNEANRSDLYKYVGTTIAGNEILINKEILGCNLKILTGFIEPHFFAGFSGGGKALVPGSAHVKTIKFNHSIKQLSNENARWGITEGNPLWEEIMQASEFVPGLFLLNVTLNKKKEITGVFAGDLRRAHAAGCKFVKDSAMVPVKKLYDIVITSNSGYPLDLNIYQTVKGMSAAAQIVKQDGHIIIAAECWDGIPSNSDYEKILAEVDCVDNLLDFVKEKEERLNDTWQIFLQAQIQKKANVYLYSDRLDNMTIKRTLLNPVNNIDNLVRKLIIEAGISAKICVLPEGPHTIPYLV
jgi:nickel-dependent lactate racemase